MLDGRYPSDEFAELRARDRLGPHRRRRQGPPGRAAARGHERGHDPRPRALRRPPRGRRRPRRRARRGDGLRGARRPDVPARRLHLADRGDHARPRARLAGAGRAGRGAVLEGRGRRPALRAGRGDRRAPRASSSRSRTTKALARLQDEHMLDERAAHEPAHVPAGAAGGDRRGPVATARSSSSASATRSATGGSASSRPSAAACTRRGRSRSARGCASRSGSRRRRSGRTTGSRSTCPTPTRRRRSTTCCSSPSEIEELVTQELGDTALFGARFRENAGRSLLIPRRRPGERTPLWQQRLKAQSLLQVARRYPAFPIVLETYRECLQDVFDLPALKRLLQGLRTRQIDLVDVETASASPYAASLLFDYVANYMYEDDTPAAERRAQALSLDRDLLRELLGQEELRDLIDPGALEEVEEQLRGEPRTPDELHDLLRLRGDLRDGRVPRGPRRAAAGRAARGPRPRRRRAAADRGRGRRAATATRVGAMPPGGLPEVFLEADDEPLQSLVRRFARGRGPFTTGRGERALRPRRRAGAARARARATSWCAASCARAAPSASGATRTCCAACAAPRSPRCARRSSRPSRPRSAASCRAGTGIDRRASLREALVPLQGLALPVALWESEVLPRRVPGYRPEQLDAALRLRRGRLGRRRASTASRVYFREDAPALGRRPRADRPEEEIHDRLRAALGRSALFWHDLLLDTGLEAEEALPALWDLVWAGEVTNDAWTPLRAARRYETQAAAAAPAALLAPARGRGDRHAGPLVARPGGSSPAAPDRRALAELLLERQGIVTRDGVRGEGIPGGYGAVYGELRALETLGLCRRGYFVEGLGGAQFALGGAVERLRELRPQDGRGARAARARRRRSRAAVRRGAAVAEARRRPRRARRGRPRRPARRRAGALRRARRPLARPAARARRGVAASGARRARRARAAGGAQAARGRALRRRAGRRDARSCRCSSRPASSPGPRRAVLRP